MLKIDDLHVHYGNAQALKGISLTVEQREMVTLIGANGAGKSTTLRAISGLIKPRRGSIEYGKTRIDGFLPYKVLELGIIHIPERRELFPEMTVSENLELGAYRAKGVPSFEEKLNDVFNLFPILKKRNSQLAGTLSGGEQQMLAIGRGLMGNPILLLLDEPSLGLAPIMVEMLAKTVQELHLRGMTIVLVEQNAYLALSLADRAYILEAGRIVLEGASKNLFNNELVKKSYLGM